MSLHGMERIDEAVDASLLVDRVWPHLTQAEQIVAAHLTEEPQEDVAHNLGVTAQAVGGLVKSMRRKFVAFGGEIDG